MCRFCSSPTNNMRRARSFAAVRGHPDLRKNRVNSCFSDGFWAVFPERNAEKAPHNMVLRGAYPSRRSGVAKPGLERVA